MNIPLTQIPEDGLEIAGEIDPAILALPDLAPTTPIRCFLHLSKQDDAVLVRGRLEMSARTPCARCLEHLPIHLLVEDFVLLTEDLSKAELDISPAVREEMLLVLPQYSKCSLDAQGNCPVTGKNWSTLDPAAPSPPLSDPWSELDKFQNP